MSVSSVAITDASSIAVRDFSSGFHVSLSAGNALMTFTNFGTSPGNTSKKYSFTFFI